LRRACGARDPELAPWFVWRGKDALERADPVTVAPPIGIQEKIRSKAIIGDL